MPDIRFGVVLALVIATGCARVHVEPPTDSALLADSSASVDSARPDSSPAGDVGAPRDAAPVDAAPDVALDSALPDSAACTGSCTFDWSRASPPRSPEGRYDHAMAYDSARGVVVLTDGVGPPPFRPDTWEYDGATWRRAATARSPSARTGHAMVYDSVRRVAVLFGGTLFGGERDDATWEYDGSDWTLAMPRLSSSPPGRTRHGMAYDAARGVVVLFGGILNFPDNKAGDTWEYDGVSWRNVSPAVSPVGRSDHTMVYDSVREVVVLFGGEDEELDEYSDTWSFDGTTWTRVSTTVDPGPMIDPAMAFDSARGLSILYTIEGLTWAFDGSDWAELVTATLVSPPRRFLPAMAFDSRRERAVLFGGNLIGAMFAADTWELGASGCCR